MGLNKRRTEILLLIQEDGHAKVQQLSKIFNVSEVTIRQDLEELEKLGYVQREHGGAFLKDVGSFAKSGMLFNQAHIEEKKLLAKVAAQFVNDGESIILDSGSTTTELARCLLMRNNLVVLTNALNIAYILGENPGISLFLSGGEFKAPTLSMTGELAAGMFKGFHAEKLFLATAGITLDNLMLTYPSFSDLAVKKAMIKSSAKVYLLADSSKIGNPSLANLGSISMINTLITDSKIAPEVVAKIEALGVEVIIAE